MARKEEEEEAGGGGAQEGGGGGEEEEEDARLRPAEDCEAGENLGGGAGPVSTQQEQDHQAEETSWPWQQQLRHHSTPLLYSALQIFQKWNQINGSSSSV
jgi:hypothetical protein